MRQVGERRRSDRAAGIRGALVYGGAAALSLAAPALRRRARRRLSPQGADAVVTAGLVMFGSAVIAALERLFPFREDWNRSRGDLSTDLGDLAISDALGRGAATMLTAPVRTTIRRSDRQPLARLPLPLRVVVLLLAFDLGHYTMHRVMHERAGWRYHAVHHSPDRLYYLNAPRFHPVEVVIDGAQELIMLSLLRPDADTAIAYQVFRGLYGQIQHANIDLDSGPLNHVLSTAERHRWHHSTDPAEGNTNYGAVVAVWDRAFGSSFVPGDGFDAQLGNGEPHYPTDWWGQVAAPFASAT